MRIILPLFILCISFPSSGQSGSDYVLSPEEAVSLALENHPLMINQSLKTAHDRYALRSSWDLDPAEINYRSGELYGPERDRYIEFNQDFGSLLQHVSAYRIAGQHVKLNRTEQEIQRKSIIAEVNSAYYFWIYKKSRLNVLEQQQELYSDFERIAVLKYSKGEIDLAEKTTLVTEAAHASTKLSMAHDEVEMAANKVRQLIASDRTIVPSLSGLTLYMTAMSSDTNRYSDQLMTGYYNNLSTLNSLAIKLRSSAFFPQLSFGVIRQDIGLSSGLWAWQLGLSIPLWFPSRLAGVKQARIEAEMAENEYAYELQKIDATIENLVLDLNRTFKEITYYDRYALVQANQLKESKRLQRENEEIEYIEYVRQMDRSAYVMLEYLDIMNRYNQIAIQLEFYAY